MSPESLDNTSNSFLPKLKILDISLSSQNMRGQTAHNKSSSSIPLGEKGDVLYLKTSILSKLAFPVSDIPWSICCPVIAVLPWWSLADTSLVHLMKLFEVYVLCLPRKGCDSDCMIRNQKSGWTLHCMMNLASLCKFLQWTVPPSAWIVYLCVSLSLVPRFNTRLCSHISDFTPPPTISLKETSFSSFTF